MGGLAVVGVAALTYRLTHPRSVERVREVAHVDCDDIGLVVGFGSAVSRP